MLGRTTRRAALAISALAITSHSVSAFTFTLPTTARLLSRSFHLSPAPLFAIRPGAEILVEIDSFGPLGASVLILEGEEGNEETVGTGLILQSEIHEFREKRDNVDVVVGEVLTAFAQQVRPDGKVNVGLKPVGKTKRLSLAENVLEQLQSSPTGSLPIGDRSPPEEIKRLLGDDVSKSAYKQALGTLYKDAKIERPGKTEVRQEIWQCSCRCRHVNQLRDCSGSTFTLPL